ATAAATPALPPDFRLGRSPLAIGRCYASATEQPAVRGGGRFAADQMETVPVTEAGVIDLVVLEAALAGHDRASGLPLVAVMLVNNETGIIQPVAEAALLVHAHGGLLVVDAVQGVARMPVDIAALDADFVFLSSHKIGGPKGVGALVARGEALMPVPLIHGGGQEKGHRSGTENFYGIVGFGAAAETAAAGLGERAAMIVALRDELEAGMRAAAPDVQIHGADVPRIGNTCYFTLPGLKSETGQIAFDLEGISLSAGAACSSGKVGESHVLTAMGRDAKTGALRISLGPGTTKEDIALTLAAFVKIAGRRRGAAEAV